MGSARAEPIHAPTREKEPVMGSSKVWFDDTQFVRSQGRKPRGRGSWAFCPAQCYDAADYLKHTFFTPGATLYAEARKMARAHFASVPEAGCVVVCP
jgi:hypothetical protein